MPPLAKPTNCPEIPTFRRSAPGSKGARSLKLKRPNPATRDQQTPRKTCLRHHQQKTTNNHRTTHACNDAIRCALAYPQKTPVRPARPDRSVNISVYILPKKNKICIDKCIYICYNKTIKRRYKKEVKKTCSFRLNEYTIKEIEKIAKAYNLNKTEVIEIAVQCWTQRNNEKENKK